MTGVPIKRGNLGTDTHTGRCHVQMKAEIRVMHLQAKDHLAQSATTRGCGGRQAEAREKLGERPRRGWGVGQDKGQGRGRGRGQGRGQGRGWGRSWSRWPLSASKAAKPTNTLVSDVRPLFSLQSCKATCFCHLSHPACVLCHSSPRTLRHSNPLPFLTLFTSQSLCLP